MRHRLVLEGAFIVALVACASWGASASAARQSSARPVASSAALYRESEVLRAFKSTGLKLYDTGYGTLQPVTTLASVAPHQGWIVAVYLYPTVKGAKESYDAGSREWRASGFAAAQTKNAVVTVVPKGRILGKKATAWPMPALVAETLVRLAG